MSILTRGLAAALVCSQISGGVVGARPTAQPSAVARTCDLTRLSAHAIEGVTLQGAVEVAAGGFVPPGSTAALQQSPSFCRVQATAKPTPSSSISFEVWVPQTWNQKIVVAGNAGYSNALSYRDMASALSQGYAAAGGDTGHQTSTPDDLLWGVGQPERIVDWGSRSIHAIAVPARRIVEAVAALPPRRAYFYGCSTGGHQAYAELQRYPQDFDGVIAGAPGNNRVRLNVGFLWQYLANHRREDPGAPIIPASKLPVITKAVVASCDAVDGVTDGVVDDPRQCTWKPSALRCPAGDEPGCLTAPQVEALERLYAGARNSRTGEQIYPGWPKSSEALTVNASGLPAIGWHQYWGGAEPVRANFWRYWVFNDPQWSGWAFDFDRDIVRADETIGRMVDQRNPDLSAFAARGGKAIVYQGWQDPVVNALDTIAYYEQVRAKRGSQADTDGFLRLFLVPGMGHCSGGTGATAFGNQGGPAPISDAEHDLLRALDAWVENGKAPDRIVASRTVDGKTVRTRPLCAYPKKAVYTGEGSTDDGARFVCR